MIEHPSMHCARLPVSAAGSGSRSAPRLSAAGAVLVATVVACGTFGSASANAATNLLVNGGFETGDFSGWALTGDTASTGVQCTGPGATVAEGICSAFLSTFTAAGTLSQSFATTSGASYVLTFAALFQGDAPSSFAATVGGQTVLAFTNPYSSSYQNYVVNFKAVGTSSTVAFTFRDDPNFEFIDNVGVAAVTPAVPEPTSAALLLGGLGLVAWHRRRGRFDRG